ncbi:MAG TPA: KEOPS complex subunit Cgi121 [Thermoplasmata archaeon]|nr:KEOPS complex subunit Cgi121 [Thermoplasmata archaeon]
MTPLPPSENRSLQAVGARRRAPGSPAADELVKLLRAESARAPQLVALLDADAIAGERHLLSAWAHLGRSRSRGESRLRDRGAELLLYLSGEEQLPRALARVGVGASTERFVLLAERPRELPPLLGLFGLVEEAGIYPRPPTERTLERLGITAAEAAAVGPSGWEGLVLERVAFVDLSPTRASSASETPAAKPAPRKGRTP